MKRLGLLAIVALLALCMLATAASAGTPKGTPSFTFYGGFYDQLDQGDYRADTPAYGNTTQLHWRIYCWMQAKLPGDTEEQPYWYTYDWNYVALDAPGPYYPGDPNSVIPGWHYHWGTGVISTDLPSYEAPFTPPKTTWLWTLRFAGVTTPAGVHYITEYWTGCNKYKGLKAICTWTMSQPDFQDVTGKGWILH